MVRGAREALWLGRKRNAVARRRCWLPRRRLKRRGADFYFAIVSVVLAALSTLERARVESDAAFWDLGSKWSPVDPKRPPASTLVAVMRQARPLKASLSCFWFLL